MSADIEIHKYLFINMCTIYTGITCAEHARVRQSEGYRKSHATQ